MTRHPSRGWSDKGGPFHRDADNVENAIERQALDILARLNPAAADVMQVQGRHVSDRLAADTQRRRLDRESSHDISGNVPALGWAPARREDRTTERLRERATAGAPRDGEWRGWAHMDDAQRDAWLEQQAVELPEELHYRSPDLDDFNIPVQRDNTHVQEQVQQ